MNLTWTDVVTAISIALIALGVGLLLFAVLKAPELPVSHRSLMADEDELETRPLRRLP